MGCTLGGTGDRKPALFLSVLSSDLVRKSWPRETEEGPTPALSRPEAGEPPGLVSSRCGWGPAAHGADSQHSQEAGQCRGLQRRRRRVYVSGRRTREGGEGTAAEAQDRRESHEAGVRRQEPVHVWDSFLPTIHPKHESEA